MYIFGRVILRISANNTFLHTYISLLNSKWLFLSVIFDTLFPGWYLLPKTISPTLSLFGYGSFTDQNDDTAAKIRMSPNSTEFLSSANSFIINRVWEPSLSRNSQIGNIINSLSLMEVVEMLNKSCLICFNQNRDFIFCDLRRNEPHICIYLSIHCMYVHIYVFVRFIYKLQPKQCIVSSYHNWLQWIFVHIFVRGL